MPVTALTAIDALPMALAATHAVLGLTAILSLAKFEPLLTWPRMLLWIAFIAAIPLVGAIVWFSAGRRRYRARLSEASGPEAAPEPSTTQ